MLLQAAETLPEGPGWTYELKLAGFRALAIKTGGAIRLGSRNDKDFNQQYPAIAKVLAALPDETVVDGEVVALDATGGPSFSALQNGSAGATIVYYVFDVMVLGGRNVMGEPLATRRDLLTRQVLPLLAEPVREAPRFDAALADLIAAVRAQGLEGLVAKRLDSVYEPGARSGAWRKMRLNRSQGFVIGGYTRGGGTFDAIVIGRWDAERLVYVARTRVGFTPASRERLMAKLRPIEIFECPFANLPEARSGRGGRGTHGGEDEAVRLGAAGAVGGGGVRGVDGGGETAACAVCGDEGREGGAGGRATRLAEAAPQGDVFNSGLFSESMPRATSPALRLGQRWV
jgi:ATP-dependent DNA ligase